MAKNESCPHTNTYEVNNENDGLMIVTYCHACGKAIRRRPIDW